MKLVLEKGQQLFFTSDTHYSHSNICSATTNWSVNDGYARKFDSLQDMNQRLVDNINNMVGEDDILIHLGDWSFGGFDKIEEFRSQITVKTFTWYLEIMIITLKEIKKVFKNYSLQYKTT